MAKKVILLGLAVLLAMAPIGCGSDNDNNNDDDEAVLNVYAESSDASSDFASKSAATDVAGLQALTITFSTLDLRRTDGEFVSVVDQDSEINTVDLVAAFADPQQLASFNIPQGDYNGIRGFIDVVEITDAESETCPVSDDIEFGPVISPQTITVDDTGSIGIDVTFPVLSGDCVGGVGTVSFGEITVGPHGIF
jgi:hypothetical protein